MRPRSRPRRIAPALGSTLILLLLAPALASCGDGGSGVEVGDVVPARQDAQFSGKGVESVVALPIGRLEVTVGESVTEIEARDTRQLEQLEAPEGSAFVPITWQYDAATFGALSAYLDTQAKPVVDLVADGASYRLPAPEQTGEGAESFYVLVRGKGRSPQLTVAFDGVSQQVDLASGDVEAGAAASLYDIAKPRTKRYPCAPEVDFGRPTVRPPEFSCSVTRPMRLPYAGDAWAEEGRSWLVVTVRTTLGRWNELAEDLKSGAIYYADKVESTYRLGKTEAARVIRDNANTVCPDPANSGGCTSEFHVVFDVAEKASRTLTIDQDYELLLASTYGGAEAKATLDLGVTAEARLRK
ncbi:hypothetical protein [Nocardioides humi]|uniref:Lipoprotein n=1 Tax=Nocardioides humi TaxID=449461 RepID=A0ABN1ZSS5_9ACTN|nr:hypothetical protein [Nocardioides humi]